MQENIFSVASLRLQVAVEGVVSWYRSTRFASLRRIRKVWNKVPTVYTYQDNLAYAAMTSWERRQYKAWRIYRNEFLEALERVKHFRARAQSFQDELVKIFPWEFQNFTEKQLRLEHLSPQEQIKYWKLQYELTEARRLYEFGLNMSAIGRRNIIGGSCPF